MEEAQSQLNLMTPEQQLAFLTGGDASEKSLKQKQQGLNIMNQLSSITNNQMNEIESKLRMERDMKMEIMNNAVTSSNRNSTSPEAGAGERPNIKKKKGSEGGGSGGKNRGVSE